MKNIPTSDHRLFVLVDAVREWYEHTNGHDVGPKLNKVANAYGLLVAGTGTATERPTGQPDLPTIIPEMIPSPNAQPETAEPAIDPLEARGRAALVEETRKAWSGREVTTGTEFTIAPATVDLQTGRQVSTSGYVATRPMIVEDQARDEFLAKAAAAEDQVTRDARQAYENRYHKIAAEVGIQAWTMAYRRMVEAGVQECSGKEIEALARTLEA
jgi:hypothetical protein